MTYKEWSKSEERYLIDNAGKMPLEVLCAALDRSVESVKQHTKQLNAKGACISLRYKKPRTVTCPSCGKKRSRVNASGSCRCCELNALIDKANADISKALQKLNAEQRAIYGKSESRLRSRVDPFPPLPVLPKKDKRKAERIKEDYALTCELIEIRNLERVLKARRKRYERICGKFMNRKNQ